MPKKRWEDTHWGREKVITKELESKLRECEKEAVVLALGDGRMSWRRLEQAIREARNLRREIRNQPKERVKR